MIYIGKAYTLEEICPLQSSIATCSFEKWQPKGFVYTFSCCKLQLTSGNGWL